MNEKSAYISSNRVSQISHENKNPRSQLFAKTVVNDIKKGKIFSKCFPIKLIRRTLHKLLTNVHVQGVSYLRECFARTFNKIALRINLMLFGN